jgi:hypothetical protein
VTDQADDERATKIGSAELDPYNLAQWFAGLAPMKDQNAEIFHENAPAYALVVGSLGDPMAKGRPMSQVLRLNSFALTLSQTMAEFLRAIESKNVNDVRSLAPRLQQAIEWIADRMDEDEATAPSAWSRQGTAAHTWLTQDTAKRPQTKRK